MPKTPRWFSNPCIFAFFMYSSSCCSNSSVQLCFKIRSEKSSIKATGWSTCYFYYFCGFFWGAAVSLKNYRASSRWRLRSLDCSSWILFWVFTISWVYLGFSKCSQNRIVSLRQNNFYIRSVHCSNESSKSSRLFLVFPSILRSSLCMIV